MSWWFIEFEKNRLIHLVDVLIDGLYSGYLVVYLTFDGQVVISLTSLVVKSVVGCFDDFLGGRL